MRQAGLRIVAADGRAGRSLDEACRRAGSRVAARSAHRRGCSGTRPGDCPPTCSALADDVVAVPIYGKAESLNLAAAAAVCLYASAHASRASRAPSDRVQR
jgi:TrmH family RNA methyltransferase